MTELTEFQICWCLLVSIAMVGLFWSRYGA